MKRVAAEMSVEVVDYPTDTSAQLTDVESDLSKKGKKAKSKSLGSGENNAKISSLKSKSGKNSKLKASQTGNDETDEVVELQEFSWSDDSDEDA